MSLFGAGYWQMFLRKIGEAASELRSLLPYMIYPIDSRRNRVLSESVGRGDRDIGCYLSANSALRIFIVLPK